MGRGKSEALELSRQPSGPTKSNRGPPRIPRGRVCSALNPIVKNHTIGAGALDPTVKNHTIGAVIGNKRFSGGIGCRKTCARLQREAKKLSNAKNYRNLNDSKIE